MATRVWGPVLEERARELGALAAASSVLLKPTHAPADLLSRVRDAVPSEVLPVAGDTADTLRRARPRQQLTTSAAKESAESACIPFLGVAFSING